mmetsp:Transcript_4862/g.16821  ORF Transcript_4862/g.16821 Transcript_4862/m.16821 type:complete len:450 (+) Transcript_4862:1568-2917(+)
MRALSQRRGLHGRFVSERQRWRRSPRTGAAAPPRAASEKRQRPGGFEELRRFQPEEAREAAKRAEQEAEEAQIAEWAALEQISIDNLFAQAETSQVSSMSPSSMEEADDWLGDAVPDLEPFDEAAMAQWGGAQDADAWEEGAWDDEDDDDDFNVDGDQGFESSWGGSGTGDRAAAKGLDFLASVDTSIMDKASRLILEEEQARLKALSAGAEGEASVSAKDGSRAEVLSGAKNAKVKVHRKLRVVAGSARRMLLHSPTSQATRPMMAVVKGAVFNQLLAWLGTGSSLRFPEGSRWLDLYAGTGNVAIEAMSRGCAASTMVELDPWVIENCMSPNLDMTGFNDVTSVHQCRVEDFLSRASAAQNPEAVFGGPFQFVSVCPPYQQVTYAELLPTIAACPLIADGALVVVEYPEEQADACGERVGRLARVKDRRYGRTRVAIYEARGDADQG